MKLFVSDFDRTFYVNHEISHENIEAVKMWQQRGNLFLIATGRELTSLDSELNKYSVSPDFYICNNGAAIYDKNQTLLYHKSIVREVGREVVEYIHSHYENSIGISSLDTKYKINECCGVNTQNGFSMALEIEEITKIAEFVQIHKKFSNKELVQKLAYDLEEKYSESVSIFLNVMNVDIVALNVSKATAIDFIATVVDVRREEIYVMGDSYNDIDMIRAYDGFAMLSAEDVIKSSAKGVYESVAACMKDVCK